MHSQKDYFTTEHTEITEKIFLITTCYLLLTLCSPWLIFSFSEFIKY